MSHFCVPGVLALSRGVAVVVILLFFTPPSCQGEKNFLLRPFTVLPGRGERKKEARPSFSPAWLKKNRKISWYFFLNEIVECGRWRDRPKLNDGRLFRALTAPSIKARCAKSKGGGTYNLASSYARIFPIRPYLFSLPACSGKASRSHTKGIPTHVFPHK